MQILKKDHYLFGLAIGILTPFTLYTLILLGNMFLMEIGVAKLRLELQTHVFISIFGNLLPIRYYFVNLQYDKTGRGVLLITFVVVLVFFAFKETIFHLT